MNRIGQFLSAFGRFWWNFIIGDDWAAAAGVLVLIAGSYLLLHLGYSAWWFGPVVIVGTGALTIRRQLVRDTEGEC